jgi:hypothetical protein
MQPETMDTTTPMQREPVKSRPLPIALAHELARVKVSDQHRQEVLGRIFRALAPGDQFKCRFELMQCRAARRGELLAEVS